MGYAAIPYIVMAAAAGAQAYNTNRTANKQDAAAADSIRNQSRRQRDADAKVAAEVQKLESSNSSAERSKAIESFGKQLRTNRKAIDEGLVQNYGSDAFKQAGNQAVGDVAKEAEGSAGLLARMDAPSYQRLNEGFSRGMLATDINEIARGAQGQEFIDRLRINGIRRNPWIDAASQVAMSYAGGMAGGAGGAMSSGGSAFPQAGTGQGFAGFGSLGMGGGQFGVMGQPNPNQWGAFTPRRPGGP